MTHPNRMTTKLGTLVVIVGALIATLTTGPAHANTSADLVPTTGAIFNDPTGTAEQQYAIRDHVQGLVESTDAGAVITMSIYNVTNDERGFADALVAAADRGVSVRVVMESSNAGTDSAKAIVAGLGTDKSRPSWAVVCSNGCHGSNINHNKFYLFSQVSGQSNVVVQSSANLTVSNSQRYWNNAVTFVGNAELYHGYLDYFGDLSRNKKDAAYYRTFAAGEVKGYHFPRSGTGDTVANTLENVNCTAGAAPAKIRIGMWYFGRTPVAEQLARLGAAGCQIEIVYTDMLAGPKKVLDGAKNVTMKQLPESGDYIIHSKYYIIDGYYVDSDRKVVFTGSPNFSDRALRSNDETMLRIYSAAIHDQYLANFQQMFAS
ncbi:phosphatidylserine/phosphatidylglycerophosphate/cardiolipin synthase-like enzyme [Stackebrandtia endophytica]|uniref:phospholipase D n=1 Tax=Stackebrandtia endophytica TaxID=1496996 RepID=A0A543B3D6_9ACTN|nr:phosphatidylserine/phosphatidylglycerophosphate/cardiolipin synthase family protein [Stackebrandtia endophytica]TQL79348.1 phosphatidylserine/phosphatidylglycerophosphate/cardiolipin synthase-like enzyme [Stackebrandtia endophytica]